MKDKKIGKELEALIKEVIKRQDRIIPVVGDDCFVGFVDDCKKTVLPLRQWIAEKLLGADASDEIKRKIQSEGYRGLDILYEEYIKMNEDAGFVDYKDEVASIVDDGVENKHLFLRKDVKDFLVAGKFAVIATTCPFHILEKELTLNSKKYNVCSFAPYTSLNGTKSVATLSLPSIYQVFGDCEGEFVAGEDDLLRFLHHLNQTDSEKGFGASQLVKYIKDKGQDNKGLGLLMPIGCGNLPNWLFRFLWYPFSWDKLIGRDKRNQGGVWYEHSADEGFYKFLRKYRFKTFSEPTDVLRAEHEQGDPVLLILSQEFRKTNKIIRDYASKKLHVIWDDNDEWDFFISYASEDIEVAKKVYDILTIQCKKRVWMDNRIRTGDEYWSAIQYGIEHSRKYLFIITESYLRKAIDKNHRYITGVVAPTGVYHEIERIKQFFLVNKRDGQKGYTYPVIIKGTKVTYTDCNGTKHNNELLESGVLEMLPKFKEYEMLQTDSLFYHIQDCVCAEENLEENLAYIIHNE